MSDPLAGLSSITGKLRKGSGSKRPQIRFPCIVCGFGERDCLQRKEPCLSGRYCSSLGQASGSPALQQEEDVLHWLGPRRQSSRYGDQLHWGQNDSFQGHPCSPDHGAGNLIDVSTSPTQKFLQKIIEVGRKS